MTLVTGPGSTAATRQRWQHLCTPLKVSGLLYCDAISLSSTLPDDTAADMVSMLCSTGVSRASCSFVTQAMSAPSLELDSRLSQLVEAETYFLEQLEHLRDYYLAPLLGEPTPPQALQYATGGTAQISKSKSRFIPSVLSTLFKRKSHDSFQSSRRASTTSIIPRRQRSNSLLSPNDAYARNSSISHAPQQAVYYPSAANKAIIFSPFEAVEPLISVHTRLLYKLKQGFVLDVLPQVVVQIISESLGQLSIHKAHIQGMVDAMCAFESLVVHDEKLAKVIDIREKDSDQEGLCALLTTIPVSCIWYYGGVLRMMRSQIDADGDPNGLHAIEECLDGLECIAASVWPTLEKLGDLQRIAVMQRRMFGVTSSMLMPGQRIHRIDSIECSGVDFTGKRQAMYAMLLADRLVLLKSRRGHRNLGLYRTYALAKVSFAYAEARRGEESETAWLQELKSLTTVYNYADLAFEPPVALVESIVLGDF
ncbi:hypothetical protein THASP1DRAFT_31952 [Thamnocephalis sphaerospora]|uniref:DH domain-containing protein n=1 Tax=Thamnocephalis sphaerospora TaxID=78915 RepID=A0A4P9XKA0_9FUNG|nr:hypothetical protein THASP1DRAFT_31952 [Thamnocephalis sphaerospora]|eukprot:RKP06227.1 hypothetical protein THASP1DRAFT_31952 [Thamnocephalis sphaerospora]